MSHPSAGARFRQAMKDESPLQVIGAINANHALLAKRAGFRAIYLSGQEQPPGASGFQGVGQLARIDMVILYGIAGTNNFGVAQAWNCRDELFLNIHRKRR